MSDTPPNATTCPWCGHIGPLVAVHGHEQCEACGTNVTPCCGGADPATEAAATRVVASGPDPSLFARVFAELGGEHATVATDALLFALVQRLGTDLDDAKILVEAGERTGAIVAAGRGCHRLPTR